MNNETIPGVVPTDYKFDPPRNAKGHFLPGHGGAKHRGSKKKITERMLKEFSELEAAGTLTPLKFWVATLNGHYDEYLECMAPKDSFGYKMKASENLARYVYDASLNTEEAEKAGMSPEQIEDIKAVFAKKGVPTL